MCVRVFMLLHACAFSAALQNEQVSNFLALLPVDAKKEKGKRKAPAEKAVKQQAKKKVQGILVSV